MDAATPEATSSDELAPAAVQGTGVVGSAQADVVPIATSSSPPEYSAPALDKALDILEVLSSADGPLSQADLAAAVGRSVSQIFRVVATLERRGYLFRDAQTGLYLLSTRLFDLAHRQEPLRSLAAAALPVMRRLADETRSSCNLSVYDADRMRVVCQVVSPSDFGFQVRVGALFPLQTTASGLVQLAFPTAVMPGAGHSAWGGDDAAQPTPARDAVLAAIVSQGYLVRPDALQPGITDIVHPVLDTEGRAAVAVLTVPYVATSFSERTAEFVGERASIAARNIADSLLGTARSAAR
jgi:DNA-binding IclR family transcriptional regulator